MHGPFAAVVIATPLEFSSIEFEGVELPHIPARKFQSTVSTFVRGHLNGSYFGLKARPKGESLLKCSACMLDVKLVLSAHNQRAFRSVACCTRHKVSI